MNPSVVILSCGRDNRFGHPHKETLARLEAQGAKVYRTDRQGALTLETDGTTLNITAVPAVEAHKENPPVSNTGGSLQTDSR